MRVTLRISVSKVFVLYISMLEERYDTQNTFFFVLLFSVYSTLLHRAVPLGGYFCSVLYFKKQQQYFGNPQQEACFDIFSP